MHGEDELPLAVLVNRSIAVEAESVGAGWEEHRADHLRASLPNRYCRFEDRSRQPKRRLPWLIGSRAEAQSDRPGFPQRIHQAHFRMGTSCAPASGRARFFLVES